MSDFRMDLLPETATRRLSYWQSLDAAIDASDVVADVLGSRRLADMDPVKLALQSVISGNIRLAKAQIAAMAPAEVRT